ncbi:MAG TPA: fatty acid desaturase [Prosthecobacter sp.]|nr:fatty acid desaturase [Prosthecobacter sp.]
MNKSKQRHILACLLPQLLILTMVAGIWGGGFWLLLPTVFLMVAIPALDLLTGWQDTQTFEKSDFTKTDLAILHWNTRLYAIFYVAIIIYLAATIRGYSFIEAALAVLAAGLLGGIGFGASHELLHCKEQIDQFIQRITTAFLFYPHYKLIHIRSHHVHAGTDHDENTAWLNESIYSYIARTIPGSMVRCWKLEQPRDGRRLAFGELLRNQMVIYALGQVALLAAMFIIGGGAGLLFYVAHVIVAHVVLESVNYIQHYGLMREKADGEYEKTGAEHSWDTYHYFSSYITFRVGHHSYHHIAVKPYYLLVAEPEAPKLPVGYFWAIPMVFLPGWWRRVINPRLQTAAA